MAEIEGGQGGSGEPFSRFYMIGLLNVIGRIIQHLLISQHSLSNALSMRVEAGLFAAVFFSLWRSTRLETYHKIMGEELGVRPGATYFDFPREGPPSQKTTYLNFNIKRDRRISCGSNFTILHHAGFRHCFVLEAKTMPLPVVDFL